MWGLQHVFSGVREVTTEQSCSHNELSHSVWNHKEFFFFLVTQDTVKPCSLITSTFATTSNATLSQWCCKHKRGEWVWTHCPLLRFYHHWLNAKLDATHTQTQTLTLSVNRPLTFLCNFRCRACSVYLRYVRNVSNASKNQYTGSLSGHL